MSKRPHKHQRRQQRHSVPDAQLPSQGGTDSGPTQGNTEPHPTDGPQFAQPSPIPDSGKYAVQHPSDTQAYKILDAEARAGELGPTAFPPSRGGVEPRLQLADILGPQFAQRRLDAINQAQRLVFHAVGDTGNVRSRREQDDVVDKMVADYDETDPAEIPSFFFHLGDVIYNFGEVANYYDQFYDPYRNYPAPIIALAGNHDGIVSPLTQGTSLEGFTRNFCQEQFQVMPEAGGLDRTAQIQPGVYYTFEAPMLRVIALYTNTLEDPGVISSEGGKYPQVTDVQLDYLRAALNRVKADKFDGALIIAHHHPIFTYGGGHGDSVTVMQDADAICEETGVWPHAVLSAHVHNYQRFTRTRGGTQIPYIIAGNGGHGLQRVAGRKGQTIRVPAPVQKPGESVMFESYDDTDYGYLRIVVTPSQLRIEYHPSSDGAATKAPDDFVTVDLATRSLVHFTG